MAKNQHELNGDIERFLAGKDARQEAYSAADLAYINQYEGSGGQAKHGAEGKGLLYEFYTPDWLCSLMWELALHYGYDGGTVMEPACGPGRLIKPAPDQSQVVGFEINPVTARIATLNCPKATIHRGYFETAFMQPPRFTTRLKGGKTWLSEAPFSLVIGNPPYGLYGGPYAKFFPEARKLVQVENLFMVKGLELLRQNGLLIYLTATTFLRNGIRYDDAKIFMGGLADLVDAYRLPSVFRFSDVPTDILIFRRK